MRSGLIVIGEEELLAVLQRPYPAALTIPSFREGVIRMLAAAEPVTISEQIATWPRSHRRQPHSQSTIVLTPSTDPASPSRRSSVHSVAP